MRFWLLDILGDFARRHRARKAASTIEDPELREVAERVYFIVDRIAGVRPSSLDLDAPLAPIVVGTSSEGIWDRMEIEVGQNEPRRLHLLENLRTGSTRHLMNHLCICPICRK